MDRLTVNYGQVPLETDLLQAERFVLTGLAKLSEATLGTSTVVSGFTLTPTSTASLSCVLSAGQIYEMENLEATAWSSLGVDSHSVLKQGIVLDPQTLTFTPPSTTGYAQYALVQVTYVDQDTGAVVRPYYNASNPTQPYSGPGNAGTADNTQRLGAVSVSIKYGVAATSGQQVAPTPDAGYAGLFLVSLAFGQTTIGASQISQYGSAPFIPATLPAVPDGVQSGKWRYGTDTGTASNLVITLSPTPASLTKGMEIIVSPAFAATGSSVANVAGFGNLPITRRGGGAVSANDWTTGDIIGLRYTGTSWMLAGLVPSDIGANGGVLYGVDSSGTAGTVVVNKLSAAITAVRDGMVFAIDIANSNPGTTLNLSLPINGTPTNFSAVRPGGLTLRSGDVVAGGQAIFVALSGQLQLMNTQAIQGLYSKIAGAPSTNYTLVPSDANTLFYNYAASVGAQAQATTYNLPDAASMTNATVGFFNNSLYTATITSLGTSSRNYLLMPGRSGTLTSLTISLASGSVFFRSDGTNWLLVQASPDVAANGGLGISATNNYKIYPDGIIENWGEVSIATGATATVTLLKGYTVKAFAFAQAQVATAAGTYPVNAAMSGLNQIIIGNATGSLLTIHWRTIGT